MVRVTVGHPAARLAPETLTATVASVLSPGVVARAARILGQRGIAVMPLKGVLLQRLVYRTGPPRPIGDVDLLVEPARWPAALDHLRAHGYRLRSVEPGGWQALLTDPEVPLLIDLHARISRTPRSALDAYGMFARGRRDDRMFDASVILPDARDIYAHLVIHAGMHLINDGHLHHPTDFVSAPPALDLRPEPVAQHLDRVGASRWARFVLPEVMSLHSAFFSEQVLHCLPPDQVGDIYALCARHFVHHRPRAGLVRRLLSVALNPSATAAARAVAAGVSERWKMVRSGPSNHRNLEEQLSPAASSPANTP